MNKDLNKESNKDLNKDLNKELNKDLKTIMLNENKSLLRSPLEPYIKLYIEPFYYCNYKCSYCYLHTKGPTEINYKKLYWFLENKFIPEIEKRIFKYLNLKEKKLDLIIVGGEISLKSLEFFKEFFYKLTDIFNDHFDDVHFSFLTNFFRPVSYYIDIHNYIKELNKKFKNIDISISYCASLHEEHENLNNFVNKIYEASQNGLDMCCHIFQSLNDLLEIKDEDLSKKIRYLNEERILEVKAVDDYKYRDFINKYNEDLRPVKCYAYNYKIRPDFTIYQRCYHQSFNIINFKPKLYYFCDKVCSCASDESYFKKEILFKKKENK